MADISSLALRPKTLSKMLGQEKLIKRLLAQVASGRIPRSYLITGPIGCGKTTIAEILSISFQCSPKEPFGEPSEEDWAKKSEMDIMEVNAAHYNGVAEMGGLVKMASYLPSPGNRARVIFLDEVHQLSKQAQTLLLAPIERPSKTTYWLLGTSEPDKLLPAFRRRCYELKLSSLDDEAIKKLLLRAKKYTGFDGSIKPLAERLSLIGTSSPGVILMSFEAYVAGANAKEAVQVGLSAGDSLTICRRLIEGDWSSVATELKKAKDGDAFRQARLAVLGYCRSVLLGSSGCKKAEGAATTIALLSAQGPPEEPAYNAWVASALYRGCKAFR